MLLPGGSADAVTSWLEALRHQPGRGSVATAVGTIALLLGAAGVFGQLQDALNTVWNVAPPAGSHYSAQILLIGAEFTQVYGRRKKCLTEGKSYN